MERFFQNTSLKKLILIIVLILTGIIFTGTIGFFSVKVKSSVVSSSKRMADSYTIRYATNIQGIFNDAMAVTRTMKDALSKTVNLPDNIREKVTYDILRDVLENNDTYLSTWIHWELRMLDPNYHKINGRKRMTMLKLNDVIKYNITIVDTVGTEIAEQYGRIKAGGKEELTEPYYDTSTKELDGILMVSPMIPIMIDNDGVGLVGIDLSIDKIQEIIPSINPFEGSEALLLAPNNVIVAHSQPELANKSIFEVYADHKTEFQTAIDKINNLEPYSFEVKDKQTGNVSYLSFAPVKVGRSDKVWAIATETPLKVITKESDRLFIITIIAGIIGILLLVVIIYFLLNVVTKKLVEVVDYSKKVSDGDLTQKIKANGKNEINVLAASMNSMVTKLREIVGGISSSSKQINTAGSELSQYSEEVSVTSSEQAASSEEVMASVEEMTAIILNNRNNANETKNISEKALISVKAGKQSANEALEAMKLIAEKIDIISEISKKTHVLAINAAIEAANAGESGIGFSVVAYEVKKLAEKVSKSADQINDLSANSMKVSEIAEQELSITVPDIEKTSELVRDMLNANIEQGNGAEQIQVSISMLNDVAQSNAAVSEELNAKAAALSNSAKHLAELIKFFKME